MKDRSHWNYRVVKKTTGYWLHEVYYDRAGKPMLMSTEPDRPYGETKAELIATLEMMLKDAKKPAFKVPKAWEDK